VILGAARAVGETAPVLLTSIPIDTLNFNPISKAPVGMNSLPLMAYTSVQEPEPVEIARGFGAAGLLLIVVLILFTVARRVGGRGPGVLTPGQQRRRATASRRDAARFIRHAKAAPPTQELR
jgi:phosphate transport system permease protein